MPKDAEAAQLSILNTWSERWHVKIRMKQGTAYEEVTVGLAVGGR